MGLFGNREKKKASGVSLIVNQIERGARRRSIPKVLAVLAIVVTILLASFTLTQAAEEVDKETIPQRDETLPKSERLEDYVLRYVLVWDTVNEGGGYGMEVTTSERSQDLQLVKKGGATLDPRSDIYMGIAAQSCVETGATNQQYEFPASFTAYYPNRAQSRTVQLPYCIGDDERTQLTYTAHTSTYGFGTYEMRGTILDGEVVGCGFLGKCWQFHEHPFAYKFDVKKEGQFW